MTKRTEYRVTLYALSLITKIICRLLGNKRLCLPLVKVVDTSPWIHKNDNTCAMCIKTCNEINNQLLSN